VDTTVLLVLVLIPSVILHEVSHGAVADLFGDDTARRAGRLTLNPLPHVDAFGTVVLPALLAVAGGGAVFGYAKPVPVRPSQMRRPRDHGLLTALAGPATNVVLAVLAAVALRVTGATPGTPLGDVLVAVGVVNVLLAAFNLVPLPPLDGSAVVERLLPERALPGWHRLRRYSLPLVFAVVLLVPGALTGLFRAALDVWLLLL
jgi:Zn-dependent protease